MTRDGTLPTSDRRVMGRIDPASGASCPNSLGSMRTRPRVTCGVWIPSSKAHEERRARADAAPAGLRLVFGSWPCGSTVSASRRHTASLRRPAESPSWPAAVSDEHAARTSTISSAEMGARTSAKSSGAKSGLAWACMRAPYQSFHSSGQPPRQRTSAHGRVSGSGSARSHESPAGAAR